MDEPRSALITRGDVEPAEFFDYACGYCRQSLPDIAQLIAKNPDLRIVVRELPIISPHSAEAARMASTYPAQLLGLDEFRGHIAEGCIADLVLLDTHLQVQRTWIAGL